MADLSDVQNALVAVAAQALYPAGTAQPSAAGVPCRIYAGWPAPASLDADLAAGVTHVTVFPRDEERNTTRFPADWQTLSTTPPTLTLAVGGQTVTVGGAVAVPQNAVVLANGQPYVYALQGGDTLSGVATALAALIAVDIPGTVSSGAVITLPADAHNLIARVGVHGVSIREIRRQVRHFQFTVWSDTPSHRDAVAQPVDVALAAINYLTLADGMAARLIYQGSPVSDQQQKPRLFQRDFIYSVEYATTQTADNTAITQDQLNVGVKVDGASQYDIVSTTYY